MVVFNNRTDAGIQLGEKLLDYKNKNLILLALPRGGVVVGHEISQKLKIPLHVIVVRKIGSPHNPEFGVGAVGENNTIILDEKTIRTLGISQEELKDTIKREMDEVKRRIHLYRNDEPLPVLRNKIVLLVDDGLATGITAQAAVEVILKQKPKEILFAAPVCSSESIQLLKPNVTDIICLSIPSDLQSIGSYYHDFSQTTDEEVISLLNFSTKKHYPFPTR